MEPKGILEIISRRKWIAIQAFLVIFLTAVIGSHFLTPIYETSAKLLFEAPTMTSSILSTMGMKEIAGFIPPRPREVDIGTKVTLTKVNPLLEKVIFKLQVRDGQGELLSPDRLLNTTMLSTLFPTPFVSVKQDTNSNTVTITASSPDPHEAMFLANTLAKIYIEDGEIERKKETKGARSFIKRQIVKVKQDYNNVLKEITDFHKRRKIVNLEVETKVAIEKLAELMKEKEDNIIDLSETRARIETLNSQLKGQTSLSVPTSFIKENPQIERLKHDLSQLKAKLADELTDKTEDHPDVIAIRQQIKELEKELEKEVQIHQVTSPELNKLERQLAALEVHLVGVNKDINKYAKLIMTLPEKTSEETRLRLALTASQDIYSSLLDYRNRIGVAEAMTLSDTRLVQPALRPVEPKSPNKPLNATMGGFLGLIFGFGLALLFEYVDDTIKTPQELEEYKELIFLGPVPRIGKPRLIAKLDANDPISEAYRTIRYSIKYASLDKPVKGFLITSSGPGEGKTLTLANLGISFSQAGSRVLMVDTDLRRPSLHELFHKPNEIGLTNVVAEESQLEEAILDTGIEGLSLLPSGPTPPDPGRMLESTKLNELIHTLNERYDVVILDSAPVLIKSDATVLGHYVDGVIYILEAGKTSRRAVAETGEVLKKANIRLLGAVLNRYEERKAYPVKAGWRRMIRIGGWRREA